MPQSRAVATSRYVVGIDLGTSHTVVAYCSLPAAGQRPARAEVFPLPQLVGAQGVEPRPLLASCLYAPLGDEPAPDRWGSPPWFVGEHARRRGREVPGRAIVSAKSWLSHGAIERTAAILPWGLPPEDPTPRLSPVAASARVLEHVRLAWDAAHGDAPLGEQRVILTVPASFDPIARELTLRAAVQAGLTVRLLEEPQAAFYDYLAQQGSEALLRLVRERGTAAVLVCDVGGGTTDLTLIRARSAAAGALDLERVAVGRHLLLGGDNMDLALAHEVERRLPSGVQPLEPRRFAALVLACRGAKERLLDPAGPDTARIGVAGAGAAVVGATLSAEVSREEISRLVLDGFFPDVALTAVPARVRGGLVAFGLPYEADPAITRHLAAFWARSAAALDLPASRGRGADRGDAIERTGCPAGATVARGPDALLLNGGVFHAAPLAERLVATVAGWSSRSVELLAASAPELAVARGAVSYGLALVGQGMTIGGGATSAFYVALDAGRAGDRAQGSGRGRSADRSVARRLLCVVPRGAREGELHVAASRPLALRLGEPVRFEVYSGDASLAHAPGEIVPLLPEQFVALPPVAAEFPAEAAVGPAAAVTAGSRGDPAVVAGAELRVHLEGELTPLGTLELACVAGEGPSRQRFRLAFDLRAAPPLETPGAAGGEPAAVAASGAAAAGRGRRESQAPRPRHHALPEALAALDLVFGKGRADARPREAKDLWRNLEKLLGERAEWTTDTARTLFDALATNLRARRRSADHERVFWMLAGFCLRPGFGETRDARRVGLLVPAFAEGLAFPGEARGWQQFFIAWRRVAGGLEERTQLTVRERLDPFLAPVEAKLKKPKGFAPLAAEELLELASWLERVPIARRVELGNWLLERTWTRRDPRLWAAIGRLGARAPLYASVHHVLPPSTVERWLDHLLREKWHELSSAAGAAAAMARVTDDRARDVSPRLRETVAHRLREVDAPPAWIRAVSEHVAVDAQERAAGFGEGLPVGLRLMEEVEVKD